MNLILKRKLMLRRYLKKDLEIIITEGFSEKLSKGELRFMNGLNALGQYSKIQADYYAERYMRAYNNEIHNTILSKR